MHVGEVLTLLAMLLAWWLGRRLSRPVEALDGALGCVERLEFDPVALPELQSDQVREWRPGVQPEAGFAAACAVLEATSQASAWIASAIDCRIFSATKGLEILPDGACSFSRKGAAMSPHGSAVLASDAGLKAAELDWAEYART